MRTAHRPLVAAATALALLLAGCASDPSSEEPTTDGVGQSDAATVDGRAIGRDEVSDPVNAALDLSGRLDGLETDERTALVEPLQRQVLSLLIQASLIREIADQRGIALAEDEVEQAIAADLEALGDEDALAEALASQQLPLSLPLYRDVLLPTQLLVEAIRNSLADEVESVEARQARHILLETEQEAQDVLRALTDGEDFAELAQERSTDVGSGAQGGDLGMVPRGAYVEEFEAAVWAAEPGVIIGPIQTEFGFHVLQVTDEGTVGPDEMPQQQLQAQLEGQLADLLAGAFADADIQVSSRFGTWNSDQGEVVAEAGVGSPEPTE